MSRPKVLVNKDNAEKIYQYFSKSIFEERLFNDDSVKSIEGKNDFLKLGKDFDLTKESQKLLQSWIDKHVPIEKWTRCLATLRQIRSSRKHNVKSVKLDMETYVLLKNYSGHLQISIPETISKAIKPLWEESIKNNHKGFETDIPIKLLPDVKNPIEKQIQVKLYLFIENNSKFVRGKKKVRENIERFYLSQYQYQKLYKDGYDYILTIPYETEEELNETIEELLEEMHQEADMYHCYVEADISSMYDERYW
jgi:DNA-binding Lrp family transcriptional regulator